MPLHTASEAAADGAADPKALRRALGTYATGVTVVTTRAADGKPVGLTVNSFSSVSLEPPLVLWSLSRRSPNLVNFERASHFAINVLAADQAWISQRFAGPAREKFADLDWEMGPGGAPLIHGCVSHFLCRQHCRHEGGDHVIVVGEVKRFTHTDREPLVFLGGAYHRAAAHPGSGSAPGPCLQSQG